VYKFKIASAVWMLTVACSCMATKKNSTQPVQSPLADTARMHSIYSALFASKEEMGLAEDFKLPEHQRDKHPSDSPISIFERVECFKLDMCYGGS